MGMATQEGALDWVGKQHDKFDRLSKSKRKKLMNNNDLICRLKGKMRMAFDWNTEKFDYWIFWRNPELGNISPAFMIAMDRGEKLEQWVDYKLDELKAPDEQK